MWAELTGILEWKVEMIFETMENIKD
jgi:hypothetical protein